MRRLVLLTLVGAMCGCARGSTVVHPHELRPPDSLHWQRIPRDWIIGSLPSDAQKSGEFAIIHGDPTKADEPFIIRLRAPGTSAVPLHWHDFDENVTVLAGVWCLGTGDRIDSQACTAMPAGSFIFIPRRMRHWVLTKDTIVEIHGIGPFRIYLVQ